jgi:hypothetical protein
MAGIGNMVIAEQVVGNNRLPPDRSRAFPVGSIEKLVQEGMRQVEVTRSKDYLRSGKYQLAKEVVAASNNVNNYWRQF